MSDWRSWEGLRGSGIRIFDFYRLQQGGVGCETGGIKNGMLDLNV